jgi:hypothetical protein
MGRMTVAHPTLCALAMALALASPTRAQTAFETPPTLDAASLAPPDLLRGPHFSVAPKATIDGYLARFKITSEFGPLEAHGTELLRIRVSEIPAIGSLAEVSQSKAFGDAAKKSAGGAVDFAKDLAKDPKHAVDSVGAGIGAFFGRAERAAKQGADYASDKSADARAGGSSQGGGSGSFKDDPLGYNKAKREWAKKLGIDPYSTNPILQEKLAAAARATFAGDFATGAVTGLVVGPAHYAVDFDQATRDSVWDKSPGDLEAMNEAKLAKMGVTGRPVRDFFRNTWFTPTLSTALVAGLEQLPGAGGRAEVIAASASAASEVQARFMVNALRLLRAYDKRGNPIAEIRMSGRVPVGVTKSGTVVVPAALDYLAWTKGAADFVARKEIAGNAHVLLLTGKASATVTKELGARGWRIETAALSG